MDMPHGLVHNRRELFEPFEPVVRRSKRTSLRLPRTGRRIEEPALSALTAPAPRPSAGRDRTPRGR
ncbi:hypothetical protein SGPA1_11870 [Streptomyces misionensis JCM 4497]